MRKLIFVTTSISMLTILFGCSVIDENESITTNKQKANFQNASNVTILTDSSTGCNYVIIKKDSNNAVMSPYYDSSGEVYGCGK